MNAQGGTCIIPGDLDTGMAIAGIFLMGPPGDPDNYVFVQALDEQGDPVIEAGAALIYVASVGDYQQVGDNLNIIPAKDGLTAILDIDHGFISDKIYAKHIFWDGSLGGPIPLEVTLTPQTLPIQIPPTGGSFQYDITIADTTPVGGSFDAWIEAILPNGSTLEILSREEINITPGETISRLDVVQNVPANAPSGNYSYKLIIGQHDCQYPWVQDSFSFSKLSQWDYPVYDGESEGSLRGIGQLTDDEAISSLKQEPRRRGVLPPAHGRRPCHSGLDPESRATIPSGQSNLDCTANFWLLTGFFDELAGEMDYPTASGGAPSVPVTLDVSISPNPFNPITTISFELLFAAEVKLDVFDINGRNVGARHALPMSGSETSPATGYYSPGHHTIIFDGSGLPSGMYFVRLEAGEFSSVKKMVLLK